MWLRWLSLGALATLAACPPPEPPAAPIPPVSTGKVHVRVFTEPSAVRQIASVGKYTFVAADDALERWDDAGGYLVLTTARGLPGDHIVALATDNDRQWLWILSDGGLGHYDTVAEVYTEVAAPPAALAIDYAQLAREGGTSLAAAAENGVWLGTAHGLYFVTDRGGWVTTPVKDPVHALVRDRAGWLWIAARGGLFARKPSGELVKIAGAQGCEIVEPRLVATAPGDRVVVIGTDEQNHERIAFGKQFAWTTYRALPELAPEAAALRGSSLVVMGGGRLYRIAPSDATGVRPLARDGMRLVATSSAAAEWVIDPIDLVLPPSASTLATVGDQLLVGTRDLGTARYRDGEAHPHDWLRRKEMFADATTLTIACTRPQDCWLATGAHQAWHWNGDHFVSGGPDDIVLAVARDPSGPIFALHRAKADKEVHLSRIDGTSWTQIAKVALTTPGDAPEISFARFASSGSLWVGLRYLDGNEHRAYGIAIVEPASGKVAYHRTEQPPDKKMLPVPVGVVDADVRGDTAWFATSEGVARLIGSKIKLWTEADGLRSELARAVTIAPEGGVIVATGAGAGVWDGKAWDFPAALRFEINDVVATKNGQVWMATERGIAAWDGKKVRRVDTRRGLAENEVLDVVVDQFDRVWARGPSSITLISQ